MAIVTSLVSMACAKITYVDMHEYLAAAASIAPATKQGHHGTVAPHVDGWRSSNRRGSCAETAIAPASLREGSCVKDSGTNVEEANEATWVTNRGEKGAYVDRARRDGRRNSFVSLATK